MFRLGTEIAYLSGRWRSVAELGPSPRLCVGRGLSVLALGGPGCGLRRTRARGGVQHGHVLAEIPRHILARAVAIDNLAQGRVGLPGRSGGIILWS